MVLISSALEELVMIVSFKDDAEITFSEKDLPVDGRKHNHPLYIRAELKGFVVPYMMVDDSFSINVYPLKVLAELEVGKEDLTRSVLIIKTYDDSKGTVEVLSRQL